MPLPPLPNPVPAGGSGGSNGTVLTFAPGYTGDQSNIYADWETLYADFSQLEGPRFIYFDSKFSEAFTIPAGTYDMDQTTWVASAAQLNAGVLGIQGRVRITLLEGVYLTGNFNGLNGALGIIYEGVTAPCITYTYEDNTTGFGMLLNSFSCICCNGTQPFAALVASSPAPFILSMGPNTALVRQGPGAGETEIFDVGANVFVLAQVNAVGIIINDNTFSGLGSVQINNNSPDCRNASGNPIQPSTQTALAGGSASVQANYTWTPQLWERSNLFPTVTDDSTQGYKVGDFWIQQEINTETKYLAYIAQSVQSGSALWTRINQPAPNTVLTFRPGFTGSSPYVYSSWFNLYDVLLTIDGPKLVFFDDSLGAVTIPAGTYDMQDVIFSTYVNVYTIGNPNSPRVTVTIADGVTFTNMVARITNLLLMSYEGTSTPLCTFDGDSTRYHGLTIDAGAVISCTTQPLLAMSSTDPTFYIVTLALGAALADGGSPVFDVDTNVTMSLTTVGPQVAIEDNTLSGAGTINFVLTSFDLTKNFSAPFTIPSTQTGVSGTINYQNQVSRVPTAYSFAGTPTVNDDNTLGYKIGDNWTDTLTDNVYICANASTGAAVWRGPV